MRVSIVGDSGAEVVGAPLGVAVGVAGAALGLAAVLSRPSSAPVLTKPHDAATASDPLAHSTFLEWGSAVLQWLVDYRQRCTELPVRSTVQPDYLRQLVPATAPEKGEPWQDIMTDLDRVIVPGLTHWESKSRFFAYFKGHSAYPAVLGELVCAGINVMGFDWIAAPACTELECLVLDWLGKLLNLPPRLLPFGPGPGGAVIQGSAGEAAIVVLLAALAARANVAEGADGVSARRDTMVVYCSDQTHATILKACRVLGVGHLRELPTSAEGGWALPPEALAAAIAADRAAGLTPVACVATLGTTTSCAFDDVVAIGAICQAEKIWLHIDAAYGGSYACLDELSHHFRGLELVDSFVVNCHKKLLCPFDLSALFLADRRPVLEALSVSPEYLKNDASDSSAVVDFEHWQLPLGRRFRALKLWFMLRAVGAERIRGHLRNGVALRERFTAKVEAHPALELATTPSLALCCFRLAGKSNEEQMAYLRRINTGGNCFIIHSKLGGQVLLRLACGGIEQTAADVDAAWIVIRDAIPVA